jgi:opacity protein-like surface antigen
MYRYSLILILLCALPLSAAAQQAGEAAPGPYNRHSLTVQMGLLNWATTETDVAVGGVATDSRTNGFVGTLTYAYRAALDWAATISVGVLNAEAGTSASGAGIETETAAVMPILFGAKYSPAFSSRRSSVRPYLWGAVGPYLGFATHSRAGAGVSSETISETAFGFRTMGGADWFLGAHLTLGAGVGYHFVTDFDEPIGTEDNYSGPEFSVGIGFVFGRGR